LGAEPFSISLLNLALLSLENRFILLLLKRDDVVHDAREFVCHGSAATVQNAAGETSAWWWVLGRD
jgi:hypothetical protein